MGILDFIAVSHQPSAFPLPPEIAGTQTLIAHRDHHKYVSKVAVVTDSTLVKLIESLASHFIRAQVRQFPWGETEVATQWILGDSTLPLVVS